MFVAFYQLPQAIEDRKHQFQEWAKTGKPDTINGMVGCVFVQQVSARRYHVGWRFTRKGTPVGEVQTDIHPTPYPAQRIVWVHEGETR